jgi:NAD(P)-dependent dehydrogenase (short-subunit alcohol dehydrogenase family)
MLEVGGGKIINIGSVHSRVSLPEFTPYAASKGGIDALTVQMALALAPYKVNVNTVSPGLIEVEKIRKDPIYNREHRARQIPWGRVGFPDDISKAVVFFASEDSDFITGQILFIDGGQLAKLCLERDARKHV